MWGQAGRKKAGELGATNGVMYSGGCRKKKWPCPWTGIGSGLGNVRSNYNPSLGMHKCMVLSTDTNTIQFRGTSAWDSLHFDLLPQQGFSE